MWPEPAILLWLSSMQHHRSSTNSVTVPECISFSSFFLIFFSFFFFFSDFLFPTCWIDTISFFFVYFISNIHSSIRNSFTRFSSKKKVALSLFYHIKWTGMRCGLIKYFILILLCSVQIFGIFFLLSTYLSDSASLISSDFSSNYKSIF